MKPLLIIGSGGQLSRAFKSLVPDAVFLDRSIIDLSRPEQVSEVLERYDPYALINTAAYTQVDNAESEEGLAKLVNAESPTAMAIYCAARKIPFVHFSTDYVFDGSGTKPWKEDDVPAPLGAYGRSKFAGEEALAHIGGDHLLIRTSWLYDAKGKNFPNTILRLAAEREELRVINDQFGAPTYAPHLAQGALKMLEGAMQASTFPSGIYHLCNKDETTWHGFAVALIERARRSGLPLQVRNIVPIPATQYPLPAKRPYNSRLDCTKALSMFGVVLPHWLEGLEAFMRLKRENQ